MQCKERLLSVAVMMLVLLGIDVSCGPEISPWVAYVVPVAFASRHCGFSMGAIYAVLAGALLCVGARHSGHPYSSDGYFLLAVLSQVLALIVVAWLTARLSSLEQMLCKVLGPQGAADFER